QRGIAVARDVGRDRFQAQAVADGLRHEGFVLDDQHTRAPMLTSGRISPAYRNAHTGRQHDDALTGAMSCGTLARELGVTVYGCEPDEADVFHELGPKFGVVPTVTADAVSVAGVVSVPRNRCVSVGHKSEVSAAVLGALQDAGVEHLSTRSIGFDHIDLDAADRLGVSVENGVYAPAGVADFTLMPILM